MAGKDLLNHHPEGYLNSGEFARESDQHWNQLVDISVWVVRLQADETAVLR
jgi:hypothetical protein